MLLMPEPRSADKADSVNGMKKKVREKTLKPNNKLPYAICSILGPHGASTALAADTAAESSDALGEIIVTAQRRTENIQNVPITIQALTSETISELHVVNLDEFIKYLPNVTQATNGPAQGDIFMRGLSVGGG